MDPNEGNRKLFKQSSESLSHAFGLFNTVRGTATRRRNTSRTDELEENSGSGILHLPYTRRRNSSFT